MWNENNDGRIWTLLTISLSALLKISTKRVTLLKITLQMQCRGERDIFGKFVWDFIVFTTANLDLRK
jgi:hypothetical protein